MRRTPVPPGSVGWIVLAAAALPIVIRAAKPLARKLAQGLKTVGEKLEQATVEVESMEKPVEEPEAAPQEVKEPPKPRRTRATTTRRSTADVKKGTARRVRPARKPTPPED